MLDAFRRRPAERRRLLANDLNQHSFFAPPVKLSVEDLFPWSEVKLSVRDRDHHFAAHDLALQMRIRVVLASAIMQISRDGLVRRELLKPLVVIVMQPGLVIIDKDRRSDVHRIYQGQAFPDAALTDTGVDLGGYVNEGAASRSFKPQFFAVTLHSYCCEERS